MKRETAPWWRQAEADLETARVTFDAGRYYAASWFCQQAAEKGLKALFIERNGPDIPKIHDLESLGEEVAAPEAVDQDLSAINPVFSQVRYPDLIGGPAPVDSFSQDETLEHIEATGRVLTWVLQQLS